MADVRLTIVEENDGKSHLYDSDNNWIASSTGGRFRIRRMADDWVEVGDTPIFTTYRTMEARRETGDNSITSNSR